MSDTPNIGFPLLEQAQAQKEVTVNESLVILDALLGGVLSKSTTAPPGSPSEGDAYIVPSGASGVWASHVEDVAYFFGGVWNFLDPRVGTGHLVWVEDDAAFVQYGVGSPSGWSPASVSSVLSVNGYSGVVVLAASDFQGTGLDADAAGFRGVPQNAQTGNYTLVADDAGKHIYHASGAGSGDTYTIPANGSVAFEIGTAVTFINMDSNTVSIAITTDTLYLAGAGSTGSRTLAQYGVATAVKLTSTTWIISGSGLT